MSVTRCAVLDQGEPAVRILAAIGNRNRTVAEPIATVLVYRGARPPWWAREADAVLALPEGEAPLPAAEVAAALVEAGVQMVWPGLVPWCTDLAGLVEECEAAGLTVVGPSGAAVRTLLDARRLVELGQRVGAPVHPGIPAPDQRVIEVDTLTDRTGRTWTLGLREVSSNLAGQLLLAEYPAPGVPENLTAAIERAARDLVTAAGATGACQVTVALGDGDHFAVTGVRPFGRAEHAMLEEASGASLVGWQLRIELGESLPELQPEPEGHTVEARVLARCPDASGTPTGGRVLLLSLPAGTGVRVDASLRPGDRIGADDPLVAMLTAWGRSRPQALHRLERALERTGIVLSGGLSNRSVLLALVRHPGAVEAPLTPAAVQAAVLGGELQARPDPMALVAAAVEVHEADLALARRAFRASAEKGRPQPPERVGGTIRLRYFGAPAVLRVDRIARDRYRIHQGDTTVEATVERVGEHERRITVGLRRVRVVATETDEILHVELDGMAHQITREDGEVVRAGWPALVESVRVKVGDHVTEGDPIAVLESMKMVTTVAAPLTGVVASIAVLPNAQIEKGHPLMRIRQVAALTETADEGPVGPSTTLADLVVPPGDEPTIEHVFAEMRDYLLGYDLDAAGLKALQGEYAELAAGTDPARLAAAEDRFLDLFGEIASLYRPRVEDDSGLDDEIAGQRNTQEFVIGFLQWLDPAPALLPQRYRRRLLKALGRYGVSSFEDREGLARETLWLFRSFLRVPEIAPFVATILARRLGQPAQTVLATPDTAARLARLAAATEGRHEAVSDLARDLSFHLFDEPALESVLESTQSEMRAHLAALGADPAAEDRSEHVDRLVWSPNPTRSLLLDAWRADVDGDRTAYRQAILETYARRFYRIRDLHELGFEQVDGLDLACADYEVDGKDIHLVVAYLPFGDLPAASRAIGRHLQAKAFQREAVIDLVTWREGERPEIDEIADDAHQLLGECDFGRALHRLDLTITSLAGGGAERLRTQHLTYRQGLDGSWVEDVLYRNLHPMLGKRLDLWRLSNFTLRRLPSPEDVYLFDGIAKDNPKDHRLFALAEVRDLTPVTDPTTGETTYPRLGRTGLAALAAMRSALASLPPRERPVANRLVLSVRPTWSIPPEQWRTLAESYARLARGANLQKLVLHVKMPTGAGDSAGGTSDTQEKVLTLDELGGSGMSIRVEDPGPNPVRALTRYAQKVLTAARFGSPYPYEIVRMLTPQAGDSSPFPEGTWQELELGPDDALVPTDRPPAENAAHLIVGLLTAFTDVHPDGMTRVAILSDPTQGLGNLSEPECRRINAALAYAAAHHLPVEWYAVSSGALIAMDSGTENMDWIGLTLRRIIEFTQGGGEINIIVTGINVGGQPYWNGEATMLMHTKGILVMTPASTMVLTGKQALDFSGAVSAEDNSGIGGYDRIMGPNGQGQYWAPSFPEACALLLQHYEYTYVVPGDRFPRRRPSSDPIDRDVRTAPHAALPGSTFTKVGDVFDQATNPERKQPFDMRSVMRSVTDADCQPLERWQAWVDADTSIVWDATVGGHPVCMLGLESHTVQRQGFVPSYGPPAWTSGTLFPQSSRKTARAINAASGNRPLVVLANLSGFDGSPESMRNWQLEYGAEIGRAITNFRGPIVFVVVSRYHGGAFVVFSKALTETMEIAAVEGSYASVIGGAPAAATVFAREVKMRTEKDPRVVEAKAAAAKASGVEAATLRAKAARTAEEVRSQKLREVADEFDSIHTIERARRVGSVDTIIPAERLRPYIIDAVERGMAAFLAEPPAGG